MSDLATLQRQFQGYILSGNEGIETAIDNSKVKFNVNRLDIYAQMYYLRLQEALDMSFPTLKLMMGEENFNEVLLNYINAHPSSNFTISYFAEKLPNFLKHTLPYAQCPYYGEIAEFEWGILSVVDAPDDDIATVETLQAIEPEKWPELKFVFHPSCRFLQLKFNVDALWYAQDNQGALPDIEQYQEMLLHLLWRRDLQPFHQAYQGAEMAMLLQAREGFTFAGICESLCEYMDEDQVAQFAISNIGSWLNSGFVSHVDSQVGR